MEFFNTIGRERYCGPGTKRQICTTSCDREIRREMLANEISQ